MGERRGALDGLRAVALIGVLMYHALPGTAPGGFLGVEVFFVLSGYLLTSILLREHQRTGRVGWRQYYTRRLRRLAPALLVVLGALVLLVPVVTPDDAHRFAGDLYSSLAGLTNWHLIQDHSSYFGGIGRPPFVRHLWSLSVEIQFYVVCPLVVSWLARRRPRVAIAALGMGIGASALTMGLVYSAADPSRAYYGTDARIGALLTGMLLAVVLAREASTRPTPALAMPSLAGLVSVLMLFGIAHERSRLLYPAGFLLTQFATALVIAHIVQPTRLARVLAIRPLRWLGERSYGVYLWHWPLVVLLRPRVDVSWSPVTTAAVTIAAAVILGHLSYTVIERPLLVPGPTRDRMLATMQWSVAAIAIAGLALLVTDMPTRDPIVSSLRVGQKVVSLQTPATVAPTTTTTVAALPVADVAPAPAPPPAPPPGPPGPPPGTVTVGAIGDSVMLGAAPQLQQRLGATGFIDAKVGRQFAEGVEVVRQLRAQGRFGQVVIVHLGTNGPPRLRDIDAMMAQLVDVPHVLLVTVRMPRDWESETNRVLHEAAARFPKITLVDWRAYSEGHPEWFRSDGIHLKPDGAQAYAELMGGALPSAPVPAP